MPKFFTHLVPGSDDTIDLGASGTEFNDLYIDGTANVDAISCQGDGTFTGHVSIGNTKKLYLDSGNNTYITESAADTVKIFTGGTEAFALSSSQNATFAAGVTITSNLTVDGGGITLSGTGRIQGVDTVSAATDAVNKSYVDNVTWMPTLNQNTTGSAASLSGLSLGDIVVGGESGYAKLSGNAASSNKFLRSRGAANTATIPSYETIGAADVSGLGSLATASSVSNSNWSGTDLSVANGGTGRSSLSSGQVLLGNGTSGINTRAIGISDDNIVEIDSSSVASGEYARFTANGLESRSTSEVLSDIGAQASGSYLTSVSTSDIADNAVTGDKIEDNPTIAGNLTVSGNLSVTGADVTITGSIIHNSDTNTYFGFHADDSWRVVTGGSERLEVTDSGMKLGNTGATVTQILDEDDMASNSATSLATQQSIKAYVDANAGGSLDIDGLADINAALVGADIFAVDDGANGTNRKATITRLQTFMQNNLTFTTNTNTMGSGFIVQDGDGDNVTITEGKYLKFKEGSGNGININFTDTNGGGSSDPYDLDFNLNIAGLANDLATSLFNHDSYIAITDSEDSDTTHKMLVGDVVDALAGSGLASNGATGNTQVRLNIGQGNGITVGQDGISVNAHTNITVDSNGVAVSNDIFNAAMQLGRASNQMHFDFSQSTYLSLFNDTTEEFRFTYEGDLHTDGGAFFFSTTINSDRKLKKNIRSLDQYGLNEVLKLKPVMYDWKNEERGGDNIGFIAQDVQEIIPELVKESLLISGEEGETKLGVEYSKLVVVLTNAIKEQQKQIDELKQKIDGYTK